MDIRLIVMDMDGTLLNSEQCIPEENLNALMEAQKKGIRLVLASGRSYKTLTEYGLQLKMPEYDGYFIGVNGAALTKTATMEHEIIRQLQKEEIKEIYEAAMPYDIEVMGVMDATIYDYIPDSLMELKAQYRKENDIAEDVPWTAGTFKMIVDQRRGYSSINYIKSPDEIPNPVNKICLAHTAEYLQKPYEELLEKLGHKYHFARTSPQWIECAPQGINKGAAILRLAERLGITPDQIAVFGDGENDLSMFRVVKYPIAMGNAMDSVKKEAFEVTLDNNSSGIAHFLKKHKLI